MRAYISITPVFRNVTIIYGNYGWHVSNYLKYTTYRISDLFSVMLERNMSDGNRGAHSQYPKIAK